MNWFGTFQGKAYGGVVERENLALHCWDFKTGKVQRLFSVADCPLLNINLTASGKLVAVDLYGGFHRWDALTGALENSVRLPSDVINHTDRLCRLDRDRILGTPFISQRFWVANIRTGRGEDCGRAAPGVGEVLAVWTLRKKAYMASYTGGELVEFDPNRPARFPENPRVVATPPRAMRPIAWAQNERNVYYACSAPYGLLGGTLTRYDTRSGNSTYAVDPLPGQAVCSLCYDRQRHALMAGTTVNADCESRPAECDRAILARFDAETLRKTAQAPAPKGFQTIRVVGPLDPGAWLCTGHPKYNLVGDRGSLWFPVDFDRLRTPDPASPHSFPEDFKRIEYAGRPGRFILLLGRRVELWDLRANRRLRVLATGFGGYAFKVQDRSVYLMYPAKIEVLENCLQ